MAAPGKQALLFQPGKKSGDGGMAQVEFRLNIPGTGRILPMGKIAQNMSLRCRQIHLRQRMGDGLVELTVKHLKIECV